MLTKHCDASSRSPGSRPCLYENIKIGGTYLRNLETETQEFCPSDRGNCMSAVVSEPQQLPWKGIAAKQQPASSEKRIRFLLLLCLF